ncbi:MAG: response regulator [Pseudomonadota bacterium]
MPQDIKKVLIIDDDEDILFTLGVLLKNEEYNVITNLDPLEGFHQAIVERPDVILLDVMMPNITGYELFWMLKANTNTRDIPVIILTAKDKMKESFMMMGAYDFIPKPYNTDYLKERINFVIRV